MTLKEFNSKYIYQYDRDKHLTSELWEVMQEELDAKFRGDCEDYALTLKYKVEGFKDMSLYYCKYKGEGHCLGKLGNQWIDNIQRKLVDELPKQYTEVKKYNLFVVWSKLIVGKIMRIFK